MISLDGITDEPTLGPSAQASDAIAQRIGPLIKLLNRILTNFFDVSNQAIMGVLTVILQETQIIAVLADVMRTMHQTEEYS